MHILFSITKIESACVTITTTEYASLSPTQNPLPKCDTPLLFQVADINSNGALYATELRTFLDNFYQGNDKDYVATNIFKFYKISKNDEITFAKGLSIQADLIKKLNLLLICG